MTSPLVARLAPPKKVTVTFAVEMVDGSTETYEFHNIGFDPRKVREDRHGVTVDVQQQYDEGDYLGLSKRLVPSGQPAELDLRIRGLLKPKDDERGAPTHTLTVRRKDADQ